MRDLIATSADRIVIQRGLTIADTLPTELPQIDADQATNLLVAAPLTVANLGDRETVQAKILLATENNASNALIYSGSPAGAVIATDDAVIATDVQQAEIAATELGGKRSLRRPFPAGASAVFTLPAPITNGRWTVTDGQPAVARWDALPPIDTLIAGLSDMTAPSNAPIRETLELSAAYITAGKLTQAAFDTAMIPGYQPAWEVDPAAGFLGTLEAVRTVGDEVARSESFTTVAASGMPQP